MNSLNNIRSAKDFCCYKCGSKEQIHIEEKINNETKEIIEKNLICIECSGLFKNDKMDKC
jgi:hypothetical protein